MRPLALALLLLLPGCVAPDEPARPLATTPPPVEPIPAPAPEPEPLAHATDSDAALTVTHPTADGKLGWACVSCRVGGFELDGTSAAWARLTVTWGNGGRLAVDLWSGDASLVRGAAGASPLVVDVDPAALAGVTEASVFAYPDAVGPATGLKVAYELAVMPSA